MELLIIILLIALLALMAYIAWRVSQPQKKEDSQGMLMLQQRIDELSRGVDRKLNEGTNQMFQSMSSQFDKSQRLVTDIRDLVNRQLSEVAREQTKTNEATSKFVTIATQLADLEKVLKHQKQRGNLGEASLELVLGNMLPPTAYKIQYRFPDGDVVDAAIIMKDHIVPIDAKFSLDNYSRLVQEGEGARRDELLKQFKNDLKLRIDETAKYVREKDGTLSFAFMYIPAEGIFYDLLTNEVGQDDLIQYAYKKKVIIVSPTTFAAYLQSVLYGFKAFQFEENAKVIMKNVESLMRHLDAYDEYYKKLGNALTTTTNHYNAGLKEFGKIDKDLLKITGSTVGFELEQLEKPHNSSLE